MKDRELSVLKTLIERYIRDGLPVGSKALAQDSLIRLSPASIRNIMADLEQAGYLHSPHTSAGRVPTAQGYRLYVDNFVTVQPFQGVKLEQLRQQLGAETNPQALVNQASSLLSEITQFAGVVSMPRREHTVLKQVEFLALSENRVLVILILDNHEVQNRVIITKRKYEPNELEQAANFLNQHYCGKDLNQVHQSLLKGMKQDRLHLEQMLEIVMQMTESNLGQAQSDSYVLAGESNLLAQTEQRNFEQLKRLFDTFARKRDVLHLLDQSISAEGVKIFIGEESGYSAFDDFSVITAPYTIQGKIVGALGVIGPSRMPYDQVLSVVDITAKLLSQALDEE